MNKIFNDFLNLCFRLIGTFLFISCAFITIIFIFSAVTETPTMIIGAIIFGIFTYLLWRNDTYNNPKKKLQSSTTSFFKDNKPNEHQQVYFKHDKEIKETEQDFVQNHSYNTTKSRTTKPVQTSILLQHINDSYNIVCSTLNPETLCSRYEFGLKRCCELKELEENGLYHGNPDANYYLSLFSPENYQKSILSCYDKYLKKAKSELKTEKSINKRIEKFWDIIKNHIDEYTYCEFVNQDNSMFQHNSMFSISDVDSITNKDKSTYPKCNCDGCSKQDSCTYGHIIYDEITRERMTLADKFIMLSALDNIEFKINCESTNTIPNEHLHDAKKLLTYTKDELINLLSYLQEQKKNYIEFGKCGRSYFNFMKMNAEIEMVKKAIKQKGISNNKI